MKGKNLSLALGTLFLASTALAQPTSGPLSAPGDAVQQTSAGNLSSTTGDSFISIYNAGANGTVGPYGTVTGGDITAQVYVFDASDEQEVACCSCTLTPDQAATMSVKHQLIANTETGYPPNSVTVKVVASVGDYHSVTNDATTDQRLATSPGFSSGLRGSRLTTHLAANYPGLAAFATEATLNQVAISNAEYTRMVYQCGYINSNASYSGICYGCSTGASGAVAPPHK